MKKLRRFLTFVTPYFQINENVTKDISLQQKREIKFSSRKILSPLHND